MTSTADVPQDVLRARAPDELRRRYEAGATIGDLELASRLSHGTVINRLRAAGTRMRTSHETRLMREKARARARMLLALELRGMYEHGASLAELADRCGRSKATAKRLVIEAGGSIRSPRATRVLRMSPRELAERDLLRAVLRSRYEAGEDVSVLAADHGISTATVYRHLHRAGAAMRRSRRAPANRRATA